MARLIVKSPYIKCGGKSGSAGAGGYLSYIGTRENVEILPDDCPPTQKQEQLIAELVRGLPDTKEMHEYEEYQERPTKANASALISVALESNWEAVGQMEGYASYIGTRSGQSSWSHALFSSHSLFLLISSI